MRPRLPSDLLEGLEVTDGVEVMTEKMVVAMPAESDVTAEVVMAVGEAFELDEVDEEIELLVVEIVDGAVREEEVPVTGVVAAVLVMRAIWLAEPNASTTASSLSQQLFLGSRLPSQHQEPSGQCCMASLPAAVSSAPH